MKFAMVGCYGKMHTTERFSVNAACAVYTVVYSVQYLLYSVVNCTVYMLSIYAQYNDRFMNRLIIRILLSQLANRKLSVN